jgi:hypothetical protein
MREAIRGNGSSSVLGVRSWIEPARRNRQGAPEESRPQLFDIVPVEGTKYFTMNGIDTMQG